MAFDRVKVNLEKRGYSVSLFATAGEAARYLAGAMKNEAIGFGGSVTLRDMGVYDLLAENNTVIWHWKNQGDRDRYAEFTAYLTSVNALAETGEMINIDGSGNRVAASLFGPKRVYFVIGRNKLAPDLASAIERARQIASPPNCKRLNLKTPCATTGKCHDCDSPERICNAMCIHMRPTTRTAHTEVVLVDEDLGY